MLYVNMSIPLLPKSSVKAKIDEVDDVFSYIGELGKFQVMIISLLSIMTLIGGYPVLIMYFAGHNPSWRCVVNSSYCKSNGTFSKTDTRYKDRCHMPRSEWEFTKPKEYSIVTSVSINLKNTFERSLASGGCPRGRDSLHFGTEVLM